MNFKVKFSDMAVNFSSLPECYDYIRTTKRLRRYTFTVLTNGNFGWSIIDIIK